jgi:CO dehydrogenase maturation factor
LKVSIAGKGGVGKTTISSLLARGCAGRGLRTLAVDCDPNPNLAESFGLRSASLERFAHEGGLRRAGRTLELAREPSLVAATGGIQLLGGPPSQAPLADAVARGIAGVLLADRFDAVVTDLGAGPELTRAAVGGMLNPADVCVVLTDGGRVAEVTAERIESACRARGVRSLRALNRRGEAEKVATGLLATLLG